MKKTCIVFALVGVLILSACSPSISTAEVNELKVQAAELTDQGVRLKGELKEQAVILEDMKDQVAELKGREVQLNDQLAGLETRLDIRDSRIRELEAELALVPRDPTYRELVDFIKKDDTDSQEYIGHGFYVERLLKNAKAAGIQGYVTFVSLKSMATGCSIEARTTWIFATFRTEKGLVHFLPTWDGPVNLAVGEKYHEINNLPPPDWVDDTILVMITFE